MGNYLGLDVSKLTVDCAFLTNGKFKHLKIENHSDGFKQIIDHINQYGLTNVHACCEATGNYYLPLSEYLHDNNVKISVVNPLVIKHYARYQMSRIKTDKQDAKLIATYCSKEKPDAWQPNSKVKQQLQSLNRRIEQLNTMRTMDKNRQQVADEYARPSVEIIIDAIEQEIARCKQQLKDIVAADKALAEKKRLLQTIPGIGETAATWLLYMLVDIDKYPTAKHFVSYLGLTPVFRQSGTSVDGKHVISKMGDKTARKAMYMPARAACTRSKLWRPWYLQKLEEGKHPKQIYVTMMRKLCVYAYTVLKTNKPFDVDLHKMVDS